MFLSSLFLSQEILKRRALPDCFEPSRRHMPQELVTIEIIGAGGNRTIVIDHQFTILHQEADPLVLIVMVR